MLLGFRRNHFHLVFTSKLILHKFAQALENDFRYASVIFNFKDGICTKIET
jgi:hypothetical protein